MFVYHTTTGRYFWLYATFLTFNYWYSTIRPSSILYLYHKIGIKLQATFIFCGFIFPEESFLSKIFLCLQELTKMVCFDLSILLARRSNINMWKGDNQEDINLVDLCKCHLSCDKRGIRGRSRDRARPTAISLGTVSVTSGCKVGADGRNKRREGSGCGNPQHYQH